VKTQYAIGGWNYRRLLLLIVIVALSMLQRHAACATLPSVKHTHPRLLADAAQWRQLSDNRRHDPALDRFLSKLERDARTLQTTPPATYHKIGRRLLDVSREVLRRVMLLSLAYRTTGEAPLAERAEREMLAAAAFKDWNPSHFLDTAEMTAALAIGYDWLYDVLPEASRASIRQAIVEKGLRLGLQAEKTQGFYRGTNNWNQVCLGGMALGALAVWEDEPELSQQLIELVPRYNPNGLKPYAPDGVYPEGPTYWGYGTTYQVILLSALETALGTDFNLSESPGFLQSAETQLQTTTPTGKLFNFFDGVENAGLEPAMYWFAARLHRPGLLRFETPRLEKYIAQPDGHVASRFLPLIALWWPKPGEAAGAPPPLRWHGNGANPLAVFRTSWDDPQAMYLGLKSGAANLSHGHMDAGSFIFEWAGIRWAEDLGMQDYESLESRGIDLWNFHQTGERWKVFRLNNFSHNTLTVNDQLHQAAGRTEIVRFSDDERHPLAIVELSAVFAGQATRVERGFLFRPNRQVLIQDELEGLKPGDKVRWAMVTSAAVTLEKQRALLRLGGHQVQVHLKLPDDARFEVLDIAKPVHDFDAPNPGKRMLVVTVTAPASGTVRLSVLLQPGDGTGIPEEFSGRPLAEWR
jgi:hypothetical protein